MRVANSPRQPPAQSGQHQRRVLGELEWWTRVNGQEPNAGAALSAADLAGLAHHALAGSHTQLVSRTPGSRYNASHFLVY